MLRRAQFRASEDPARAVVIVRAIVAAKAANQRAVLRRALRDSAEALAPEDAGKLEAAQAQAQMLARHLRGDLDGYPAFFWK